MSDDTALISSIKDTETRIGRESDGSKKRLKTSWRHRIGGRKIVVWILTFLSYAMYHSSRKIYSAIKSKLQDDKWFGSKSSDAKLGLLDALFLFFYAGGLYFGGYIGDRHDPRYVLTVGMSAVAVCVTFFGLCGAWGIHELSVFGFLWSLNGLLQSSGTYYVSVQRYGGYPLSCTASSNEEHARTRTLTLTNTHAMPRTHIHTGWPTNVAIMGSWFKFEERGLFMGIWAGNASFGNIVGTGIAAILTGSIGGSAGWQWSMIAAGMCVFATAIAIWFLLVPSPKELEIADEDDVCDGVDDEGPVDDAESKLNAALDDKALLLVDADEIATANSGDGGCEKKSIGFFKALLIPGVIPYALAYACLKSTNYALFFWLPLYLVDSRGYSSSRADFISMLFDAGQIFGAGIAGYVTDRTGRRAPITFVMILIATGFLVLLEPDWIHSSDSVVMLLLFVTGYFMGGPANLISGCISADLGTHESVRGTKAMSTVAGIIDGTGSLGAAVVQYLVGYLKDQTTHCVPKSGSVDDGDDDDEVCTHWQAIFIMLIACNILACALMSPIVYRELTRPRK